MKRVVKLRSVLSNLQYSLFIIVNACLISSGCSSSNSVTYNLNESNNIWLNKQDVGSPNKVMLSKGSEVTIIHKYGLKDSGEILSVRDSTLIFCKEYSASEIDLANGVYRIMTIKFKDIRQITIEGIESDAGGGALYGAIIGAVAGITIGAVSGNSDPRSLIPLTWGQKALILAPLGALIGTGMGAIIGGSIGTDDVIIRISPDYDFLVLKSLARYPDKEPEFLKQIK